MGERGDERRQRKRVLKARLLVADPRLDGAERRVWPHVPPHERVVLDRPGADHLADPVGVDLPGSVVRRDALARERAKDRNPRGHHPGRVAAPKRRVRRQSQEQRQVAPDPVGDVDGAVRAVDRHVNVGTEDQLAPGDVAELRDQLPVARAVDDGLLLPARERVRARGANEEVLCSSELDHHLAKLGQLRARLVDIFRTAASRSPGRMP